MKDIFGRIKDPARVCEQDPQPEGNRGSEAPKVPHPTIYSIGF